MLNAEWMMPLDASSTFLQLLTKKSRNSTRLIGTLNALKINVYNFYFPFSENYRALGKIPVLYRDFDF